MQNLNLQRNFDSLTHEKLQCYVYALRDPRDRKIFYIGKGDKDRVFSHFNEADEALKKNNPNPSAKVRRIQEIWAQEQDDVEWLIVRHGMTDQQALEVEAAVIDSLDASMNGPALNEIRGQQVARGILYAVDIVALAAPLVNPESSMTVFIFSIQNAVQRLGNDLTDRSVIYAATRGDWRVTKDFIKIETAYAVGLVGGISRGAFAIDQWKDNGMGKCFFEEKVGTTPDTKPLPEVSEKSWLNVISPAKGYYQRGNHLVVEFNGKGQFKIIRGCPNHDWTNCVQSNGFKPRNPPPQ